MEERQSLPIESLHKKAFCGFNFRMATKLDDLMFQREQFARAAYQELNTGNTQVYLDAISETENEIKKLLSID